MDNAHFHIITRICAMLKHSLALFCISQMLHLTRKCETACLIHLKIYRVFLVYHKPGSQDSYKIKLYDS